MSYVEDSKDDANWPNGQMHLIVTGISERYKDSGLSDSHARLKQREKLRALSMERNEDPNNLFNSLVAIKLLYSGTKIPLTDVVMRDTIFEKIPTIYSNTLNTTEGLWKLEDPSKTFTYKVLQKEIRRIQKYYSRNWQ